MFRKLNDLIEAAFWHSHDKHYEAGQAKAKETTEILAKTDYLRHHPDSVFYIKPF